MDSKKSQATLFPTVLVSVIAQGQNLNSNANTSVMHSKLVKLAESRVTAHTFSANHTRNPLFFPNL